MQAFWESDFERFSLKLKENINNKINTSKRETSSFITQKKQKADQDTNLWLQNVREEWLYELNTKERQGQNDIAQSVQQELSNFKSQYEIVLTNAFKKLLEHNFPALAECFIKWVLQNYQNGVFKLPIGYEKLIDSKRYSVEATERNRIVFSNENLYIEYSVERIIEEYYGEIIECIQREENKWLK